MQQLSFPSLREKTLISSKRGVEKNYKLTRLWLDPSVHGKKGFTQNTQHHQSIYDQDIKIKKRACYILRMPSAQSRKKNTSSLRTVE